MCCFFSRYTYAGPDRGQIWYLLGDLEKSLSDYSRSIDLHPSFSGTHIARGMVFRELGDYPRAISDFDRALELDPRSELAFFQRGETLYLQTNLAAALEDFRRCEALGGALKSFASTRISVLKSATGTGK